MGAKGDLGIELELDRVPCREDGMTAYEMMLSESQERMLMVLRPEKAAEAAAIFGKWGLDFAVVGHTTPDLRFRVRHQGKVEADLPIKELGDQAPEYDRPWAEPRRPPPLELDALRPPNDLSAAILALMGSPDLCSRRWIYEQYDHVIGSNTAQLPGGDAAVVRIRGHKAIALSVDVTPRYVEADPFEGGKQAVAECWRNLTAVGAVPLAITDNLNFGNPETPSAMGQLVMSISGIGEACRALAFPVVSGNVSLYNETSGTSILPTPTIGGVGLIEDLRRMATLAFKQEGDAILMIGRPGQHLGQSLYLREIHGREAGPPPPVDLVEEKRHGDFVRRQIALASLSAVHDISDGGLAACLCEMALASGLGCRIDLPRASGEAQLFGEDQARYVVTCRPEQVEAVIEAAAAAGIPASSIGSVTGDAVAILGLATVPLAQLRSAHEGWLPAFMAREV
jgi:phosphoribosylformylglycinamidine synthase